ncbi:hypothetical protein ACH3WN_32495 [Streptomyces albogriseolus]|uniref:hypothetical protein n=1 Tax=Streptomyces albogriseolus TaxID=1887 RepID=UPI0037BD040A
MGLVTVTMAGIGLGAAGTAHAGTKVEAYLTQSVCQKVANERNAQMAGGHFYCKKEYPGYWWLYRSS